MACTRLLYPTRDHSFAFGYRPASLIQVTKIRGNRTWVQLVSAWAGYRRVNREQRGPFFSPGPCGTAMIVLQVGSHREISDACCHSHSHALRYVTRVCRTRPYPTTRDTLHFRVPTTKTKRCLRHTSTCQPNELLFFQLIMSLYPHRSVHHGPLDRLERYTTQDGESHRRQSRNHLNLA